MPARRLPTASVRHFLLRRSRRVGRGSDLAEKQGDCVLKLLVLLRLLWDIGGRAGFLLHALRVRLQVAPEAGLTARLGGFLALQLRRQFLLDNDIRVDALRLDGAADGV